MPYFAFIKRHGIFQRSSRNNAPLVQNIVRIGEYNVLVYFNYEITDKNSFDELIDYWYKEVKEHCPDIILGLSGNKFDLFEHEQITEKEGKELANQLKAIFYSTSAKENVGIDALIKDIGKELLEKNYRTISFNNDTLNATKLSTETLIQKKKCC